MKRTGLIIAAVVAGVIIAAFLARYAYNQAQDDKACRQAAAAAVMAGRSGTEANRECHEFARQLRENGVD